MQTVDLYLSVNFIAILLKRSTASNEFKIIQIYSSTIEALPYTNERIEMNHTAFMSTILIFLSLSLCVYILGQFLS